MSSGRIACKMHPELVSSLTYPRKFVILVGFASQKPPVSQTRLASPCRTGLGQAVGADLGQAFWASPKMFQSQAKVGQKSVQTWSKVVPELVRVYQKSPKTEPKVGPKSTKHCLKLFQRQSNIEPTSILFQGKATQCRPKAGPKSV